jgi:hypothetical protein
VDDQDGDYWNDGEEASKPKRRRDRKVDEAKRDLLEIFERRPDDVFFGRQLEVAVEKEYFHWITDRALGEIVAEGSISSKKLPLRGNTKVRFYWRREKRYWKRQAEKVRKLILRYSEPGITRGIGRQAEMLFSEAMARFGFVTKAKDVNEYQGRKWARSGRNLDRVFERDGIEYGAEIKNTLDYIDEDELGEKLDMCHFFGVPLFIMRASPKSYNWRVIEQGGFVMLYDFQFFPWGHDELVKEIRDTLGLPVDCPMAVEDGTIQRFVKWHRRKWNV